MTMRPLQVAVIFSLVFFGWGCKRNSGDGGTAANAASTAPAQKKAQAEAKPDRKAYMGEHFSRLLAIKDAVVDGELAEVNRLAKAVAERPGPENPPDAWIPHLTEMKQVMAGAQEAATIDDAAEFLTKASLVCGRCHQATKSTPKIAKSPEPMPGDDSMMIHAWATDQMWQALVTLDGNRYAVGAGAMKNWPSNAFDDNPKRDVLVPLADRLVRLSEMGFAAKEHGERAHILGQMLATCAACHKEVGEKNDKEE